MTTQVQIFIPTSPAPWHPSTEIIERAIKSAQGLFSEPVIATIYCDSTPSWCTDTETDKYNTYCERLRGLDITRIRRSYRWIGLAGLVEMFLSELQSPLLLNFQHDWEILKPERIQTDKLLFAMQYRPEVQCVRFTKRILPQRRRGVDRRYFETNEYGVPLIGTDGWGDSPHFATKEHYVRHVLPYLSHDVGEDGRYGVEGPVYRQYQLDIRNKGLSVAQREWGSFLYGRFGEEPYLNHLGGLARTWRKNHGVLPKKE